MDELPRKRRKKKAGGKKRSSTSSVLPIVLKIGVFAFAAVVVGVGVIKFAVPAIQRQVSAEAKAVVNAWPLAPETPRVKLFGSHDSETIVPAVGQALRNPLRRRATDPWFRLSNVRIRQIDSRHHSRAYLVDVDVIHPPIGIDVNVVLKSGIHEFPFMSGVPNFDLISILKSKQKKGTIALDFPLEFLIQHDKGLAAQLEKMEFFLAVQDARYTHQIKVVSPFGYWMTNTSFKVSNSVTYGSVPQLSLPREWVEDEVRHLTGPPTRGVVIIVPEK